MQNLDFLKIAIKRKKVPNEEAYIEVYPKFAIQKSEDLMIRGRDFYAAWIEEKGCWSTDEQDVLDLIDKKLDIFAEKHKDDFDLKVRVAHMWDSTSGSIDHWHKYLQKQMRDNYHNLDETIIFSNHQTTKEDYSSKRLTYPLEKGDISAYEKLISTLYSPEERAKIEWAIGAIVSGDSKFIQKFMVFYGDPGTGKSTIINIIQKMFEGYWEAFDAEALGSSNSAFALEPFKNNPLIGIQHDGNLSRIENNARINSLTSHETMSVNEKNKSIYSMRFNAFLIMGTNKPVRISDAKSGLIRRLIDISPTGNKLAVKEYESLIKKVDFELGAIAHHCLEVYRKHPGKYDHYVPINMMSASNDFYNFVYDSFFIFKRDDGTTMKAAWELYKNYCEEAKVSYPMSQRIFKEELKNYFYELHDRYTFDDGTRARTYYKGFRTDKFEKDIPESHEEVSQELPNWLRLKEQPSIFDETAKDYLAQYANGDGNPKYKWSTVSKTLKTLKTTELHWVKVPENHIVIDFDIKNENGEKDFSLNAKAASEWPETYAELSKGGQGLHLHYIYQGDPEKLGRLYDTDIEIKVYTGNSSLRRKLSLCNDISIAPISTGLPLKKEKKMLDVKQVKSEEALRNQIERNLRKEIHANTTQSVNFIVQILDDAYNSDLSYDVSDLMPTIIIFAANSTNQSDFCLKQVDFMKFRSKDREMEEVARDNYEDLEYLNRPIVFYDVEVFPNLFLVNWKIKGNESSMTRWVNPEPHKIDYLINNYRLIGFNNRNYDNHMIYGCMLGYDNGRLFKLSQDIIGGVDGAKFADAYNLSYTDIYDFAATKQSLKKWEIALGIHHMELGLPWDEPVPEELWPKVSEYCDNDVLATEALFDHLIGDWEGRKILADISGGTANDTTNTLTTKLIFGTNRNPQNEAVYTKLATIFPGYTFNQFGKKGEKSKYREEFVGEGGYVYSEPGIYHDIALLDIASMHPHSIIRLNLFGDRYTAIFKELVNARLAIKHRDMETLKTIFGGKFARFVDASNEELDRLAYALKIAINSVYGLTSAKFPNPFKNPKNIDNIVAKYGALFMVNLKHEVQKRGFTVAHIKTDSIKIPNATPEIIKFVMDYGKEYGFTFEHEATYAKMCLVNDAVYIAKYSDDKSINGKHAGEWTATGTQFQVPFVFKSLFSKEPITFDDMCETKSVTSAIYMDYNEDLPSDEQRQKDLKKAMARVKDHSIGVNKTIVLGDISEIEAEVEQIKEDIKACHSLTFIGKVGRFTPIQSGHGGAQLVRGDGSDLKYPALPGTKGYRWLESETIRGTDKEQYIDKSYYINMANEAIEAISKYGNFDEFVA